MCNDLTGTSYSGGGKEPGDSGGQHAAAALANGGDEPNPPHVRCPRGQLEPAGGDADGAGARRADRRRRGPHLRPVPRALRRGLAGLIQRPAAVEAQH